MNVKKQMILAVGIGLLAVLAAAARRLLIDGKGCRTAPSTRDADKRNEKKAPRSGRPSNGRGNTSCSG